MHTTTTDFGPVRGAEGGAAVYRVLFNPFSMRLALVVLVASFLLPTTGLGVDVCWFKALSALPCPGCGLTRSLTNVSQLQPLDALAYHPFGLLVWPLVAVLAAANFAGEERRARVERWLRRHDRVGRRIYMGFVYAFVAFGLVRLGMTVVAPGLFAGL